MSNLDARLDGLKAGSKEHRDVLKGLSDLSMQRVELSELIRKNEAS